MGCLFKFFKKRKLEKYAPGNILSKYNSSILKTWETGKGGNKGATARGIQSIIIKENLYQHKKPSNRREKIRIETGEVYLIW